jgi:hypothetical protein
LKRGTTDAAGGFRFERLPGGRFEVRVNKVGYAGSDYDGKTYRCVLRADETGRVDVALQPTAAVQGRVLGEDDELLAGVDLYAGKIPAQSDAEGRYLIEHLAAGEYSVMVRVPYETRRKTVRRLDGEDYGYGASRTTVVLAAGVRLDAQVAASELARDGNQWGNTGTVARGAGGVVSRGGWACRWRVVEGATAFVQVERCR